MAGDYTNGGDGGSGDGGVGGGGGGLDDMPTRGRRVDSAAVMADHHSSRGNWAAEDLQVGDNLKQPLQYCLHPSSNLCNT